MAGKRRTFLFCNPHLFAIACLCVVLTLYTSTAMSKSTTSSIVVPAAGEQPFHFKVALLGNPSGYVEWTDERLRALRDAGFNGIQLNIAWLSRPNDEALNLRDVVTLPGDTESTRTAARRKELLERNALAKRHGFRTIFHFGSPYMWQNPETGEIKVQSPEAFHSDPPYFDSLNPKIVKREVSLLREFKKAFPDVDDILIYTYDQDAWQASEFSHSKLSRGIPLHKRLPGYLKALHEEWRRGRAPEDVNILWWEPWELSAGQVFKCIPNLPRRNFGMMLHNNIAEVQLARPVDVWFRNTARMCMRLGIPVVAEGFFGSANEEIQPLSIPAPRLTDEQLLAVAAVPGVVGVKEYFGVVPDIGDLNLAMFAARVAAPDAETTDLLRQVTARFGEQQDTMISFLECLADGLQFFPWDASWYARLAGTANIDHGWQGAAIRGQQVETPSWESTRRSHFMKTDDAQPHPFLLEDVQLRCEMAVQHLDDALTAGRALSPKLPPSDRAALDLITSHTDAFRRVAKSYALHIRETNVAMLLRGDLESSQPLSKHLVEEMKQLLAADVDNQGGKGKVVEMQAHFEKDPAAFVKQHLLPSPKDIRERGIFTLTTR